MGRTGAIIQRRGREFHDEDLSELRVGLKEETRKNLERIRDFLSQKEGRAVTLSECLQQMTEIVLAKIDPIKKAERAMKRSNARTLISKGGAAHDHPHDRDTKTDLLPPGGEPRQGARLQAYRRGRLAAASRGSMMAANGSP